MPGGRKPGRPLTGLELKYVRLVLEVRGRAHSYASTYDERLEDFVLGLREDGCSARGIADALGVGASTVQTWTAHARQRRRRC